ncbi:hypothetical protein QTP88_026156 [Uroleucon formosanum]
MSIQIFKYQYTNTIANIELCFLKLIFELNAIPYPRVPNIEVDPEGFTIAQLKLQSVIHQYFVIIKNNKMCKYTYARNWDGFSDCCSIFPHLGMTQHLLTNLSSPLRYIKHQLHRLLASHAFTGFENVMLSGMLNSFLASLKLEQWTMICLQGCHLGGQGVRLNPLLLKCSNGLRPAEAQNNARATNAQLFK